MSGVMDLERSLCGDCIHLGICHVPIMVESIGDNCFVLDLKLAVLECRAYRKDGEEKQDARQSATA